MNAVGSTFGVEEESVKMMKSKSRVAVSSSFAVKAVLAGAAVGVAASGASAANIGWSTTPTDNTFSGINWTASNVPSASHTVRANTGDSLFFAASTITTLNNDRVGYSYGQIVFNSGASAFTIGGNAFTATNRIFNTTGNPLQTINNDITLGGGVDHVFSNSNTTASGNIAIGGILSGTNTADTVTKNGGNTVTFSNANTYVSATNVNQGVLLITNSSGLGATSAGTTVAGNAALYLSGGITVGAEALTISGGGAASVPNTGALRNLSGSNTYGGAITTGAPARFTSDSGQLTLSGPTLNVSLGRAILAGTIRVNNVISGTTAASSVVVDAGANDASNPAINSIVTLAGANTYTGGTSVGPGRLITANATALGDGVVTVGATGATPTVGALTVGDGTTNTVGGLNGLTINDGSTLEMGGANSQIALDSGTFTLGNLNLDLNNLFNAPGNYVLIDGVDGANAIGTTTFIDADLANHNYAFNVVGNDGVLSVTNAAPAPEPATIAMIGLGGLLATRRRRTA